MLLPLKVCSYQSLHLLTLKAKQKQMNTKERKVYIVATKRYVSGKSSHHLTTQMHGTLKMLWFLPSLYRLFFFFLLKALYAAMSWIKNLEMRSPLSTEG